MIPNTLAAFAEHNRARQHAEAVFAAYCAAIHARITSAIPIATQDAIARKWVQQ